MLGVCACSLSEYKMQDLMATEHMQSLMQVTRAARECNQFLVTKIFEHKAEVKKARVASVKLQEEHDVAAAQYFQKVHRFAVCTW